ncbi:MAG: peptidylprolyl isomerase [Deltaproteobacteria bacterium]|jgi:peptidylprolyl isomerase|nr:peptidylprolyl isomerase [Deltaproteobacteria bacterium]
MPVKDGDTVKVHYRGTLDDGTEFDSSLDREPLEFTLGRKMLIPGFEKAVLGLEAGDKVTVRIPADEAYGEKDENLIFEMPREDVPDDVEPEVGMDVELQMSDGSAVSAMVTEVTATHVVLDANMELAGQALTFEIEVVSCN